MHTRDDTVRLNYASQFCACHLQLTYCLNQACYRDKKKEINVQEARTVGAEGLLPKLRKKKSPKGGEPEISRFFPSLFLVFTVFDVGGVLVGPWP